MTKGGTWTVRRFRFLVACCKEFVEDRTGVSRPRKLTVAVSGILAFSKDALLMPRKSAILRVSWCLVSHMRLSGFYNFYLTAHSQPYSYPVCRGHCTQLHPLHSHNFTYFMMSELEPSG